MNGQLGTVRNIYIIIVFVHVLTTIMYHTYTMSSCCDWSSEKRLKHEYHTSFYIRISPANYHMYEILNFSFDLSYNSAVDSLT